MVAVPFRRITVGVLGLLGRVSMVLAATSCMDRTLPDESDGGAAATGSNGDAKPDPEPPDRPNPGQPPEPPPGFPTPSSLARRLPLPRLEPVPFPDVQVATSGDTLCVLRTVHHESPGLDCWSTEEGETFDVTSGHDTELVQIAALRGNAIGGPAYWGLTVQGEPICWGNELECAWLKPPLEGPFAEIAVTDSHFCARRVDGMLRCRTDGPSEKEIRPPRGTFTRIAVAPGHVCGLKLDGTIACGTNEPKLWEPYIPPAGQFVQITRGTRDAETFFAALRPDGTFAVWGSFWEEWEETSIRLLPVAPGDLPPVDRIWGGGHMLCARALGGDVNCWGSEDGVAGALWFVGSELVDVTISPGDLTICGVTSHGEPAGGIPYGMSGKTCPRGTTPR